MVNVIVPIIDKRMKFDKILTKLSENEDVRVIVGINEDIYSDVVMSVGESENMIFVKFQKGSKREAIINALQKYVVRGSILIMRKPITIDEFERFALSKQDITTCKRNYNTFLNFIFNVWQTLIKFILGLRQYEGDTSVIYLSEDISAVMSASGNASFSTRANRWRGLEQTTIDVKGESVKAEYDKKDIIKCALIACLALIVGVVVTTCVSVFCNVSIFIGLLLICLDFICFAIAVIMIIILIFNLIVGKKSFGNALEINNISFGRETEMEYIDNDTEDSI